MNFQPGQRDTKRLVYGLLFATLMTVLLIWLVHSGAQQIMEWLTSLGHKSPSEARAGASIGVGVTVALVLPLAAYRLRRMRRKPFGADRTP